jgi:hypothetical protein
MNYETLLLIKQIAIIGIASLGGIVLLAVNIFIWYVYVKYKGIPLLIGAIISNIVTIFAIIITVTDILCKGK